jgi:cell division GTPase FtsZ
MNMQNKSNQVAIIAMGGGASNVLKDILKRESGFASIAINQDKLSLQKSSAELKLLVEGYKPVQFSSAIEKHELEIKEYLRNKCFLVLLSCLGGRTGTHSENCSSIRCQSYCACNTSFSL